MNGRHNQTPKTPKHNTMKSKTFELDIQEKTHNGTDKVSRYKWSVRNVPGEFHMIPKSELEVDHSYQRNKINLARVEDMARAWDWIACGALVVSLRDDNHWFVIDGQHRKMAADKRSDIKELPCLVFETDGKKGEALGFLSINCGKVGVGGMDKYRARIAAGDKVAVELDKLLRSTGHKAGATGSAKTVACIGCLYKRMEEDPTRLGFIWPLLSDMHPDSQVIDCVVRAVWQVDKWLQKQGLRACETPFREKLMAIGGTAIAAEIRREITICGKGGYRIEGIALAKTLNKSRMPNGVKVKFD